jgi:hypothetical protein
MATTTETVTKCKIVGALFENNHDANKAVEQLVKEGFLKDDIAVLIELNDKQDKKIRREAMKAVGFEDPDRIYFERALKEGKTLVSVTNVPEDKTGKVISILTQHGAEYNPDGSRNVRDDVVGMTTGAAIGVATGAFAGPMGAAVGALAGAAIGGVIGASVEQNS